MAQNQENEPDFDEDSDEEAKEMSNEEIDEENCFKQRENTADEVVLTFDDGQTMYVSASFLSYASPVFKAMFQHDFKEKEAREVKLTGKEYDDFHEFLLCLHPGVQRPVDKKNVLRIASIAEEYQVIPTITKCKKVMSDWLHSQTENVGESYSVTKYFRARTCLNILKKASECCFMEIEDLAVNTLARFGHIVFTGTARRSPYRQPANQATASTSFCPGTGFVVAAPAKSIKTQIRQLASPPFIQATPPQFTQQAPPQFAQPAPPQFAQPALRLNVKLQQSVLSEVVDDPKADCKRIFDNLPHRLKCSLLLARLDLCDDGNFR